jgi:copper chaperone CopZ
MNNVTFKLEGMHCTGCASTIEALLQKAGVRRVSADFDAGEARVLYDPAAVSEDDLAAVIEKAGYRVTNRSATS